MRVRASITGSPVELMQLEYRRGAEAVTIAMQGAAVALKSAWRNRIRGAGLGNKLAASVRSDHYPKSSVSLGAAALAWTKAPKIVAAHESGATIRSANGFWLAIPTEAAGRGRGGRKITPLEWERRNGLPLRFVYRRGRSGLLVADARLTRQGLARRSRSKTGRGVATVPIFILVPQVKLPKRLDLIREAEVIGDSIAGRILAAWPDRD